MSAELFSEVYGCYYQVVEQILKSAAQQPITRRELERLAEEEGFSESALFIVPRLISGEWNLLSEEENGLWRSKVKRIPMLPLTFLQKRWLAALLNDPRFQMFLEPGELDGLKRRMRGVEPLYRLSEFHYFDRYSDGDPFDDPGYGQRFRTLLLAQKQGKAVTIQYLRKTPNEKSETRGGSVGIFFPVRMEYSQKDDKLRLYAVPIREGKIGGLTVLNLGRITMVSLCASDEKRQAEERRKLMDMAAESLFTKRRCAEPIVLRIFNERNALERCMLHFSSYEKRTEHDEKTGSYRCEIWYEKNDETELLIRVLSFGPMVQVLSPPHFVQQVKQRVLRQVKLFHLSE